MYKMNYGDFDITCPPCIHWFVRYAEFCSVHGGNDELGWEVSNLAYRRDGKEYLTDDERAKYVKEIQEKFAKFKHLFKDDISTCPFIKAQYDCPLYFSEYKDMDDVKLAKGNCITCGKHICVCDGMEEVGY